MKEISFIQQLNMIIKKYSKSSLMVNVAFCIQWKQNLQNSLKFYFLYQEDPNE